MSKLRGHEITKLNASKDSLNVPHSRSSSQFGSSVSVNQNSDSSDEEGCASGGSDTGSIAPISISKHRSAKKKGKKENVNANHQNQLQVPAATGRRLSMKNVAQSTIFARRLSSFSSSSGIMRPYARKMSKAPVPPQPKYENTYKTDPDEGFKFKAHQVEKTVYDVLETKLKQEKYNYRTVQNLICELSYLIKERVKKLNFPRYKFVVSVVISSKNEQGFEIASRCMWNTETDNFAHVTYVNETLMACVSVFGVYFE